MPDRSDSSGSRARREKTHERYERAKELIPGGTQLLSKRAEMMAPDQWPAYYSEAEGARVTDLDGNEYVDMSFMGIGACVLGYGDEDVDASARRAIDEGVMATLNCPQEVELAEELVKMHPWADMVRFGRPGGEAMAMAVRLARAYSGEETVAFCGYHGWHDWYLAANLETDENLEGHLLPGLDPNGVPESLEGTSKPFHYNEIEELVRIARENDLGAIVMEPIRNEEPRDGFLERVREIADEEDAPLVVDEITSGFRATPGGYHAALDLDPDVAVYGKAMGNGYPIAAVVGRERVMDEAEESFLSSTYWTERVGPSAALATLRKFRSENVHDHLVSIGEQVTSGWEDLAEDHGVEIATKGLAPLTKFVVKHDEGQAAKTLFTQEMLDRGYLAGNAIYTSYAHTEPMVEAYLDAADDAFASVATALEEGSVRERLNGPVAHTKFERLN
ncbi:aminotransferase class III-fold pyridoxal phosphate-dependent enzyme [Halorussus sp. MSC15.2]|uniref:aminotransferase class III-fold pyridoxal phosphate-dependent enzyme n=1 Tax=Halorussus sp. MSC15.2 TaxID=2283638 RepID=UPI0013D432AF|nr:aminotransferase class III-fold pyridoxal phosphate-dependent enzyme [Halorussus sp. MSC15.2]NEU58114.1 aminotransferase class III-fold pyridoxal phosphate-dependent enzyme [Halorussus sp. MSC15.2]